MFRAVKLSLAELTDSKKRQIIALLEAYRAGVNHYIQSLWKDPGSLNKDTFDRLPSKQSRLSARYRSAALNQALSVVNSTKASEFETGITASCPVFDGAAVLDAKFVSIHVEPFDSSKTFDVWIKLSTLKKGSPSILPCKATEPLRKWLAMPGATLKRGCALSEDNIILWVDVPEPTTPPGSMILGVDIGVNKLIATSEGDFHGSDFKTRIRDKIRRKRPGSKAAKRARTERKQYINHQVKQLPWSDLKVIGIESLKNLKKGKRSNRSKAFRKALVPWTYRQVTTRIQLKAQEHGVCLVSVDPRNTSRTCFQCGAVRKESRKGERFKCVVCGYTADSDTNGAQIVLLRTVRCLESLMPTKAPDMVICYG